MDWKTPIWQQFGAAIDMFDNAMRACPEDVWPECLSDSAEGFALAAPFTKDELLAYLERGRGKCSATIAALTEERAGQRRVFDRPQATRGALLLYTMRHVQHHAGQLNLILRQRIDSAPRWEARASPTLR